MVIHPLQLSVEKLDKMAEVLSSDPKYFSDENREPWNIWRNLQHWFGGGCMCEAAEVGDFQAIIVFRDIVPFHKCNIFLITLDPGAWRKSVWREAVKEMHDVMRAYNLNKIEVETEDKKWAQFLWRNGFELEGVRYDSYMKEGEAVDFYLLALGR